MQNYDGQIAPMRLFFLQKLKKNYPETRKLGFYSCSNIEAPGSVSWMRQQGQGVQKVPRTESEKDR